MQDLVIKKNQFGAILDLNKILDLCTLINCLYNVVASKYCCFLFWIFQIILVVDLADQKANPLCYTRSSSIIDIANRSTIFWNSLFFSLEILQDAFQSLHHVV